MLSLVIPVYRNEASLGELLEALRGVHGSAPDLEVVFVVDGSPDRCAEILASSLPSQPFRSQLLVLSRNFGSFAAIRAGLEAGAGDLFAVMAADLQEPPELVLGMRDRLLAGTCDIVLGVRESREDPLVSRLLSRAFWGAYRLLVHREVPRGGIDVFGCTRRFRDVILALGESNSTLVGLILWAGYPREVVGYRRRGRKHGKSAWSFRRKARYLLDSTFAFSDLPIRLLEVAGLTGLGLALVFGLLVLWERVTGNIRLPGYSATILTVMFFGGLNAFGLGLLGEYLWRTFENTKARPPFLVARHDRFQVSGGRGNG
ncbi:MAG: glycosyltransferase family 2 protein [Holophagales bacterium]|nr:glycosyltransferase family 2 protein [Holophagales bacterium]MBK9963942.1 glycosyltransferase family 2 protein [Holophagales bacterium]